MKEQEYKETPIGRIPEEWEVTSLGNEEIIEELFYGITAKAVDKNTGLKILRTTDIKEYSADWEMLPFCEITERRGNLSKYFLKKGELIVARAGTVGVSVLVDRDFDNIIFGSYLIKVKLKSNMDPKFVHYFFQSPLYWKHLRRAQGSTLKNINLPLLKSIKITRPSLFEQRRIAGILSTVDEAIQRVDEAIARTERLKRGLMQELLTKGKGHEEFKYTEIGRIPQEWEVVKLERLSKGLISGGTPSTKEPRFWNGDIPWIRSVHITKNYIDSSSIEQSITKEGLEQSAANIVPKNNLIIATRVGIGKSAVNLIDVAINQDLTGVLLDKSKVNIGFLVWYLHLTHVSKLFESFSRGTTIKGISQASLRNLLVPCPSLQEQQKIAEILSTVEKKLELERKRKRKFKKIKQGLMNDLLTGRKRVKITA